MNLHLLGMRMLRSPEGGEGGGAASPPPPPPVVPTASVQLSPAEYQQLLQDRAERDRFRMAEQVAKGEAEKKQLELLAAKGESVEALRLARESGELKAKEHEVKAAAYRERYLANARNTALAKSLVGFVWRDDYAGAQAETLLSPHLDAVELADGTVQVVERTTRRPAGDWIKEQMASPAYAGFLKASTGGGAGGGGGTPPPVDPEKKLTLHELIEQGRKLKTERDAPKAPTAYGAGLGFKATRN